MKVTPKADSGLRLYHGRGFCVPSVTEVLGILERRHLEAWRHRVGRQEADRQRTSAALIGTKVHGLAQTLTWDRTAPASKGMELYALAIRSFLAAHVQKPLKTELSLISERERVGGTLDLYCVLSDGTYAVIDYKTSAQLSREHGLQTALYALLLREHGYEVNRRIVVRIKKDAPGQWYARSYADHTGDVKAARAAVELWHWLHGNKLLKAMEAA